MKNAHSNTKRIIVRLSVFILASLISLSSYSESGQKLDSERQVPWNNESVLFSNDLPPGRLQFDFLIGDWDIVGERYDPISGVLISEMKALWHEEYRNDKSMVVEEFTGYSSTTGQIETYSVALRTYSPDTNQWQNFSLHAFNPNTTSSFVSEWKGNEMHGKGEFLYQENVILFKIRFFNIEDDSWDWENKISWDDGENWHIVKTFKATRRF